MKAFRTMWIAVAALAVLAAPAVAAGDAGNAFRDDDRIVVGMPILAPLTERLHPDGTAVVAERGYPDGGARRHPTVCRLYLGENLTATSLRLASNYDVERGLNVVGAVTNTGSETLLNVVCRLFLGDPMSGETQIGEDLIIPELAAGATVRNTVFWEGFTGSSALFFVVDPDDTIAEENEDDNVDTLSVTLRDDVPWVWQIVNGYCNYASLAMLFELNGVHNTVYETVEFANCPHSVVYIDNKFYLSGGIMSCQTTSDYEFAGEIRNLDCDMDVRQTWAAYMTDLRDRIDSGLPVETGVDPYYLPQPDWEPLHVYDVHSGHAIVVTGYSDSSMVVNDPGVGLGFFGGPPIPNPERRGADVVVDMEMFKLAVQSTLGTPYVLIAYTPSGPVPSHSYMLQRALEKSVERIDGNTSSYGEEVVYGWPPGWDPTFGVDGYSTAMADMDYSTFAAWFDAIMDQTGSLEQTINILASYFADGMFWCQIGWEASEVFYETLNGPEADNLVALSDELAVRAESAFTSYVDMLVAIFYAGGDLSVTVPYLSEVSADLGGIVALEGIVRDNLVALHSTGVAGEEPASLDDAEARMVCAPNPFIGSTEIHLSGARSAAGAVRIYDVAGRLVRELTPSTSEVLSWDGLDTSGATAAPGVYFLRDSDGRGVKVVKVE